MIPTQTIAKPASTPKTGLFPTLCAFLHLNGSGAPKIALGTGTPKAGRWLILSVLATTLGALAFTTAPAFAAGGHEFSGEFKGTPGHELSDPTGIAVNNVTGDVYVVDKGNSRVDEFNPTGTKLEAEFKGSGTAGELTEPEAIAIDNSGETTSEDPSLGDVYVTDHNVVDKFTATGEYKGQITGTCENKEGKEETPPSCNGFVPFEPLEGVAVDPKGQVWVDQKSVEIEERGSTPIDAFSNAKSNAFLSSRDGEVGEANPGFAVDSEDHLYVPNGGQGFIAQLNSMGKLIINPTGGEKNKGRTGVAVDPSSNDVYVDKGNPEEGPPMIQVYTPGSMPGGFSAPGNSGPIETFGEAQLAEGGDTGLAVSYAPVSSGDVYVVDSTAGKIDIFTPPKATAYAESFSFGGNGTGSGQFTEPLGIAVNDSTNPVADPQAEDVYVVDKGNKRVEQFSKAGAFIRDFASPPGGFNDPTAIAVDNSCQLQKPALTGLECEAFDPSDGDVYVTDQQPELPEHHGGAADSVFVAQVDKFSSTGTYLSQLRRCPEEERATNSFGEVFCVLEGHPTAGFDTQLTGVAVGPEGNVWVGAGNALESFVEFSDEGALIEISESPTSFGPAGPGIVTGSSALDPLTGQLFVDQVSSIDRYASGEESPEGLLESFPPAGGLQDSHGIAASPAGTVYASERTAGDVKAFAELPFAQVRVGAVAGLRPTSVTLEGSVNPEGANVSSCEFEYGTTTAYGQIAECEPPAGSLGEGTEPKLVSARLSGLPSGTTYHYRLVASDAIGTNRGSDHEVKTPGPSVTAEQVTYVEATNATLNAQIDPEGSATSYRFEYDTSPYGEGEAPHGTRLPEPSVAIGAGTSPVSVSVKLTGLQAGKTYYYRAVAEGEPLGAPESFYGANETFATNQAPGSAPPQNCPNEKQRAEQPYGLGLPDCRAYEIVSPLNSEGQDATEPFGLATAPRASVCGKECEERGDPAIIYTSRGTFADPTGDTIENQFVSRRNAEKGRWETQPVEPPHEPDESQPNGSSFVANDLTPELTEGVAATTAKLTLEAPAGNDKEATGAAKDLYVDDFANGSYRYVGDGSENPLGSSTDLTHVVFGEEGAVSEWVNGHVVPVGVTNEGEEMNASVGGMAPSLSYFVNRSVWRAVSADGSRVYFSSPATEHGPGHVLEPPGQLYVRVNVGAKVEPEPEREQSKVTGTGAAERCTEPAKACTIEVSASQRTNGNGEPDPDPHGPQTARYWGASAEGEKVFFTSKAELTNDAYTGPADNAENLYEYDLETGKLTDLTGKATDASGEGAAVQGVVQISEDGSYVYFVAEGALTGAGGEALQNERGEHPQQGKPNLYVSHEGGAPVFIATLAANDYGDWHAGGAEDGGAEGEGGPEQNTAVVTPDGSRLAFLSEKSLPTVNFPAGYDNEQAATGECQGRIGGVERSETGSCQEAYLYDAETTGLVCASCDPTGARPVGPSSFTTANGYAEDLYRSRNLLEDGALFFDSADALVPHANDGRRNVYEYEHGHVYAISDVSGGSESFFMDASANGENVFFGTADDLLPQVTSNNVAVYDARVDGGFPVNVAPLACTTAEACRTASPPTPSVFGAPPSATFSGPGNIAPPPAVAKKVVKKTAAQLKAEKLAKALKVCRKDKKKSKRQSCEKQARAKYGPTKAKKKTKAKKSDRATNDRRTN